MAAILPHGEKLAVRQPDGVGVAPSVVTVDVDFVGPGFPVVERAVQPHVGAVLALWLEEVECVSESHHGGLAPPEAAVVQEELVFRPCCPRLAVVVRVVVGAMDSKALPSPPIHVQSAVATRAIVCICQRDRYFVSLHTWGRRVCLAAVIREPHTHVASVVVACPNKSARRCLELKGVGKTLRETGASVHESLICAQIYSPQTSLS